ncbi:hypothetical protein AA13595_0043 [Gluconacetobacter johannae DSM 13595]|uniref:Uncharacterized protein n=1 Tax=Gluconacetobacter johannae TaxID=112140 RepID=A0A7W4J8Y8_9PROT|nr:hypothetical protein [Gluconacetobacter johannae]MBB2176753.1 hypothetical protein [Gluconacetobacter johannae]GBQ79506.1 hypothetical protein AA13595_0043 [Gluconacetobacter johannae DSM 13595]
MTRRLDLVDAFRIVREKIKEYGSQRNFAQAHGIREQDVSDALCDRRPIPPAVLKAAGLRRVTYFEQVDEGNA